MKNRTIKVKYLARVEGEGGLAIIRSKMRPVTRVQAEDL